MARVRLFSGTGALPPKGIHPAIGALLFAYLMLVLIVLATSDLSHVRFVGPGIIPILLINRAQNRKERPIHIFLDLVENNELCLGYTHPEKTDQEENYVSEYSYWCMTNKKFPSRMDLFLKIKTVRKETVLLKEENIQMNENEKWVLLEEMPEVIDETWKVEDIEGIAIQMDRNSN